jgi:hypothetical protein
MGLFWPRCNASVTHVRASILASLVPSLPSILIPPARSRPAGEDDLVAAMATVACEPHHAFDFFHWTVRGAGLGGQWLASPCQRMGRLQGGRGKGGQPPAHTAPRTHAGVGTCM